MSEESSSSSIGSRESSSRKQNRLKSLNSEIPVKIVIRNQTDRDVAITWIDYDGNEVVYSILASNKNYILNSYVTHPWIFRDSKRNNLATFDALIGDRRDLTSLYFSNRYSYEKRFQKRSRIFYPIQHDCTKNFLLIVIINGVNSLQELCLNFLIDYGSINVGKSTLIDRLSSLPSLIQKQFWEYCRGQKISDFLED
ncbi:hypothetical protein NH340_JMT04323 [Sarcoptes scabiei]|nr:hypothetical protein NH340_JMT04323 [Sarcoptes scabiei]